MWSRFALVAVVGLTVSGCASSSDSAPRSAPREASAFQFSIRPVLCTAPAAPTMSPAVLVSHVAPPHLRCGARYRVDVANLNIQPSPRAAGGFTSRALAPDPAFDDVLDTPRVDGTAGVDILVSQMASNHSPVRYVLGPAGFPASLIRSAAAQEVSPGQWIVAVVFTTRGATVWDDVAARQFHEQLAIVIDGAVASAPLIQPNQYTFTSFTGSMQLVGRWSQSQAIAIAAALN